MRVFVIESVVAILILFKIQHSEYVKLEHVHINKKIIEDDNTTLIFETNIGLSVSACIEECKLRKRCSFVNHHSNTQMCYMLKARHANTTLNTADNYGFIYATKSDWDMTHHDDRCPNCDDTQSCQLSTYPQCIITGCGIPSAVSNTNTLGNRYIVGSLVNYKCQHPYTLKEGSNKSIQILCQENGTWTKLKTQCWYPCKDNWTWGIRNSCYLLESSLQQYNDAKTNYKQLNSHLVDIGSTEEADFLDVFTGGSDAYIGLTKSIEGEFYWSDNSSAVDIFTSWAVGEPNYGNSDSEDCVMLRNQNWHDIVCDWYDIKSICEYELSNS